MNMNRRDFGKVLGSVPAAGVMAGVLAESAPTRNADPPGRAWYETNRRWTMLRIPFYDGPPFHAIGIAPHNSAWKPVCPAIVLNSYGRGRTAYISSGPDAAYVGDYPVPEHRLVLRNMVRHLHPHPDVRVEAPLAVEAVVTQDVVGRRYLIHFIGYHGARLLGGLRLAVRPSVIEEPLLYRARIHFNQALRNIHALSSNTIIQLIENGASVQIEDIHETVIVSY
jgi:hypothetical protein